MKLRSLKSALVAVIGAIALAQSVSASTLSYTDSPADILVGFRATSGTGSSSDYIINIGSVGSLTSGETWSIGSDLSSTFGSTWSGSSTVLWGIAGESGDDNTVYASNSTSSVYHNAFNIGSTQTDISNVGSSYGQSTGNAVNAAGLIQAKTDGNSWASYNFGSNSSVGNFEYFTTLEGTTSQTLTLWAVAQGNTSASTQVGTFAIDSTGTITFTSAVPEPTTYALLALGGFVLLMSVNRRRSLKA